MSAIDSILQPADIETSRTPEELCDWVDEKATALSETIEGKRYARSGASLPKKLWEEIRPFGLFARRFYGRGSGAKCTPNLSNDNYDGRIDFDDTSIPSIYVEVTYAKDGYDESLRLDVLTAEGSVNWLGEISKSGTKASGSRTIKVQNEAVSHGETRLKALNIVQERILGKSGKTYGRNHILIIVVDDSLAFRSEDDQSILMKFSKSIVKNVNLDFKAVFLLGSTGNYLSCICGGI
jgi:hypothetical protein